MSKTAAELLLDLYEKSKMPRTEDLDMADYAAEVLLNALPKLAAVCEAAVALRSIGAPPYGAYLSWQRSGDSRSAQALESFDDVVAAARTAFDAALADLTAALGEKA